jgi:hypothetical protein
MKSTLDTHLRVVDMVLICEWRRVVLGRVFSGRVFSTSGHIPGPILNEVELWIEK